MKHRLIWKRTMAFRLSLAITWSGMPGVFALRKGVPPIGAGSDPECRLMQKSL